MSHDSFATTRWSIIAAAAGTPNPTARAALSVLCATYWRPLFEFIRRRGHGPEEAHDLTQGFFARLLEKGWLEDADRERGRFRAFLLAALKHYLSNERDFARSQKRGGGRGPISLDLEDAEKRLAGEPSHDLTPERLFERRWAMTVLDEALRRLESEHRAARKELVFSTLKPFLAFDGSEPPQADVAAALRMTEGAVKVAVHRLRKRFRELLREEVARTVDREEDVDEEIRHLFDAFGT